MNTNNPINIPNDLLASALQTSGIEQNQPSTSQAPVQATIASSKPKIDKSEIKPVILNGEIYYKTPRGYVRFQQPGNKITIVSDFEIMMARQAEKARQMISMNNLFGLEHLGQLLNNGMTVPQWQGSAQNPSNNQVRQDQLSYLNNPQFNVKSSNKFLINNHFTSFGQEPDLHTESMMYVQRQDTSTIDPNQALVTKVGRNFQSFESIFNQVANGKEIDEDEENFQADTYADYMPAKLKIGLKHPDQVVETSSLASVLPPTITYELSIDEEIYDTRKLSALQLEAIIYASQQHEQMLLDGQTRAGFLVGDGAGVGKGRTIAGIILENYLKGRKKAIWLSVSNDLKVDAERDLRDIGADKKIKVYPLNKIKYGKISYEGKKIKKGVIFTTYSSLISQSSTVSGKRGTRLGQLIDWCGTDFDGPIIFDECHKAKNLQPSDGKKSTKTGTKVLELQNLLPKARIVYASATGATEPKNMAYMVRLGLWGKGTGFDDFDDFYKAVDKRGVGAMELVAMDMKQRGMYIARQLSFKGVDFDIHEVDLTPDFIEMYDEAVKLWVDAREYFETALELQTDDNTTRRQVMGQFWSSHQRFFKYLCISTKVDAIVETTREEIKNGNTVVIGLQSTGEARTLEIIEECAGELDDFVKTAKAVFQNLVEKHFPAPNHGKSLALLKKHNLIHDDGDYSNRSSRKARKEGQKRLKENKSSKSFINDDSEEDSLETIYSDRDESFNLSDEEDMEKSSKSFINDDSEEDSLETIYSDRDESFNLSDEEDMEKSRKRNKNAAKQIISEDENSYESSFVESSDSENYSSEESESDELGSSESDNSVDSDASDEPWNGQKKRSKNKKVGKNKKKKKSKPEFSTERAAELCEKMKNEMLDRIEQLSDRLPRNTIDDLISKLGGSSEVAEMTGRKGRLVKNEDNKVVYEARNEDTSYELINLEEKEKFMNGEKIIAIISEAASSGISLQADVRAKNQLRRVHITIELPWSADRAIQQFGRTHRSNQRSAPKYIFMISKLAGEQRFASTVAKHLESLGALTHGDRRATESRDLSKFNIEQKYSKQALETVMNVVQGIENSPIEFPSN